MTDKEIMSLVLMAMESIQSADEMHIASIKVLNGLIGNQNEAQKLVIKVLQMPNSSARDEMLQQLSKLLNHDHAQKVKRLIAQRESLHEQTAAMIKEIKGQISNL